MRLLSKVLCVAAVVATTLIAKADSIDSFTLTDLGYTITWFLPSNPTPDNVSSPNSLYFATFDNVPVYYDGMPAIGIITFLTPSIGGDLVLNIYSLPDSLRIAYFLEYGPQLFTGPTSSPTFLRDQFSLVDELGKAATIVITPEPSTFLLLASGILVFGGAARRKLARV